MHKTHSISAEKIRHLLYLISMGILLVLSALVLFQSACNDTLLDYLKKTVSQPQICALILTGAGLFLCLFSLIGRLLSSLSEKKQLILTIFIAAVGVFLQYALMIHIQPVIRYDHLRVFDGALEIINTGELSLTDKNGYFGFYPFNISITVFQSVILRIVRFIGVPERYFLLSLQCVYLFLIDLGVFFSWKIVKMLHSLKNATLFALLCAANPILYVCAAGCYTTTLMLPLLMAAVYCILLFLRETDFRKKCLLGFFIGFSIAFGSRLRATVLIAGIAFAIYLLVREKTEIAVRFTKKQTAILTVSLLLGGLLSFGGFTAFQNTYIHGDYTDTQMPPIYYLMFAVNPESRGSYSETDFELISQYPTLEEKEEASLEILKERLTDYGISGTLSLAVHKLANTWSDGIEDYRDFLMTSRNYGTLHSYIAGAHKDFFALYAHMYHTAIMAMFCLAVIFALGRRCDSYYLIFLTLLGGMVFHILWESFYVYSFGFSMLLVIPASESICRISQKRRTPLIAAVLGLVSLTGLVILMTPIITEMKQSSYKHLDYAVSQDMSLGDCEPLMEGEVITQTFQSDLPFNRLGCKVYNDFGSENSSLYRMELLSSDGIVRAGFDFSGADAENGGYYCLDFDTIVPNGRETYQIRLTALSADENAHLMFGYYNTHQYDIYSDGFMTGLNSDERSDLAFQVFYTDTTSFFH